MNRLICRMLIGVFLCAQVAVAAYACPGMTPAAISAESSPGYEAASMPVGCDQMDQRDPQAANLCAEHCKFGHQSSDTAAVPAVAAPMLALLYVLAPDVEAMGSSPRRLVSRDCPAAASPPHAVLHCVLRI